MQHTNVSVAKVYYVNILASAIRHSNKPRSDLQQRERVKYCPQRESRQQTKQKQNNNNMIVSL